MFSVCVSFLIVFFLQDAVSRLRRLTRQLDVFASRLSFMLCSTRACSRLEAFRNMLVSTVLADRLVSPRIADAFPLRPRRSGSDKAVMTEKTIGRDASRLGLQLPPPTRFCTDSLPTTTFLRGAGLRRKRLPTGWPPADIVYGLPRRLKARAGDRRADRSGLGFAIDKPTTTLIESMNVFQGHVSQPGDVHCVTPATGVLAQPAHTVVGIPYT